MPLDRQSPARPAAALMDKAESACLRSRAERMRDAIDEALRRHPTATADFGMLVGCQQVLALFDDLDIAIAERDAALKRFEGSVPLHLYDAALRRWEAADREHDAAACKRNAYWRGLTAVLNGIDEGSVSLVDIRLIVVEALRSVEH